MPISQLENRAFLNPITRIGFSKDGKAGQLEFINLEPLPPQHPEPGQALATPFAIQICQDDSTLVLSAAASDKVITVDADSGKVLGHVDADVDAVPGGIVLQHQDDGQPAAARVLNCSIFWQTKTPQIYPDRCSDEARRR